MSDIKWINCANMNCRKDVLKRRVICDILCLTTVLGFRQQIPRVAIQRCVSAERDGRLGETDNFESSRMITRCICLSVSDSAVIVCV